MNIAGCGGEPVLVVAAAWVAVRVCKTVYSAVELLCDLTDAMGWACLLRLGGRLEWRL